MRQDRESSDCRAHHSEEAAAAHKFWIFDDFMRVWQAFVLCGRNDARRCAKMFECVLCTLRAACVRCRHSLRGAHLAAAQDSVGPPEDAEPSDWGAPVVAAPMGLRDRGGSTPPCPKLVSTALLSGDSMSSEAESASQSLDARGWLDMTAGTSVE